MRHAFVEMDALVDPGIAEIVQHVWLVGIELQRLLAIGFGLGPLLGALVADAAEIERWSSWRLSGLRRSAAIALP